MSERVLGAILAGGAGQRVGGADKGLLMVHGKPVAARIAARLQSQCDALVIVANRNEDAYGRIGRVIADRIPGHAGPLAGIEALLALVVESGEADCGWLLTVPVDCPDFPLDLRDRLRAAMDAEPDSHCVYARDDHKVQPLFALYSLRHAVQLLASARDAVRMHASPLRWHLHLGARPVDFSDQPHAFRNLNALKDFTAYEASHPPAPESPSTQAPTASLGAPEPADGESRGKVMAGHPVGIGLEMALETVAARAARHRVGQEGVRLGDASGRILAGSVQAPHALPPFANAAMDGFALRGGDLPADGPRSFRLAGAVLAGALATPALGAGECARITTGAPMPRGADTVVIKEHATIAGDRVTLQAGERAGANVRAAGEDYAQGDLAFAAGTPLGAAQVGVLAAFGIAEVPVRVRPRIAIIATGDELVAPGDPLGFGQIHESNAALLAALAGDAGLTVTVQRHVRDDPAALRAALLDATTDADLIVTSGGVSAGEADHLPAVLASIGEIHFHRVRVKPGMPVLFGELGACLYFGLPGNPVSAAVTFRVFVRFAARTMLGITTVAAPGRARLDASVQKRHARAEFLRCRVHTDEQGVQWATPHERQGSGMLRGLAESDALALLPEGERTYARGDVVTLWPA